jgi:hypothetical protein
MCCVNLCLYSKGKKYSYLCIFILTGVHQQQQSHIMHTNYTGCCGGLLQANDVYFTCVYLILLDISKGN